MRRGSSLLPICWTDRHLQKSYYNNHINYSIVRKSSRCQTSRLNLAGKSIVVCTIMSPPQWSRSIHSWTAVSKSAWWPWMVEVPVRPKRLRRVVDIIPIVLFNRQVDVSDVYRKCEVCRKPRIRNKEKFVLFVALWQRKTGALGPCLSSTFQQLQFRNNSF